MKHLLLALAWLAGWTALCLSLSSCGLHSPPEWSATPNPLDAPAAPAVEPAANGHFGPFGIAPAAHRNFTGSP
ncbi:MAG: hypothetical protein RLZ97_1829 [Verrucomicrobiota bacterium]|jgi:hypothetical protein